MPPDRHFGTSVGDFDMIPMAKVFIVVVLVWLALAVVLFVICAGNGENTPENPSKKTKPKRICGNKLHTSWTGKTEDDFVQYTHPVPRRAILELFEKRRMGRPKYCIECTAYAEALLSSESDHHRKDTNESSSSKAIAASIHDTQDLHSVASAKDEGASTSSRPESPNVDKSGPVPRSQTTTNNSLRYQSMTSSASLQRSVKGTTTTAGKGAVQTVVSTLRTWMWGDEVTNTKFVHPVLPSGWVSQQILGTQLFMLIGNFVGHGPSVQKSLRIDSDGTWSANFLGQELSIGTFPDVLDSLSAQQLLNHLDATNVCIGHPHERYRKLIRDNRVGRQGILHHHVIMEDESVYNVTIRHTECTWASLPNSNRCSKCRFLGGILRPLSAKNKQRVKPSRTSTSSRVKMSSLSTPELLQPCKNLATSKKHLQERLRRLQQKIEKVVSQEGKHLPSTIGNALSIVMDENKSAVEEQYAENSFGRLFWQQQQQAAQRNPRGHRWHPMMIKWCINLRLQSSRAYKSLKQSGVLKLPCETTLRSFVHWTKAKSGLTLDSMMQFCREVHMEQRLPHQKLVCIVHDEMKMKGDLVYEKSTGNLIGFTDLGDFQNQLRTFENRVQKTTAPEDSIAEYMFVIMVRGLFWNFTYPLAHYPTAKTSAVEIFALVWESIEALELAGFKVMAVTCDGASTNRRFADMHSTAPPCIVAPLFKSIQPYTADGESRFIFLLSDPPHLVKCVRNSWNSSFANSNTRMLWNGGNISWKTMEDLYRRDVAMNGLYLSKKIGYEHIYLTSFSKMKVSYAAQVLSSTVANALELYGPNERAAVDFVRIFDRFFDCLNCRSKREWFIKRKDDLKPYTSVDDERLKWLEGDFCAYLDDWKKLVEERPGLSQTEKNKMQITQETLTGLYRTARGFVGLCRFLLQQPGVEYVLSERINQDPLESFFGNQRQMKGGNDAPTVAQFNVNVNASRLKSAMSIKVYGGNSRQPGAVMNMPQDDTALPRKRQKKGSI